MVILKAIFFCYRAQSRESAGARLLSAPFANEESGPRYTVDVGITSGSLILEISLFRRASYDNSIF